MHEGAIAQGRLEMSAQLELANRSAESLNEVVLALNPGLEVAHATLNEQAATALREGETVRLIAPQLAVAPGRTAMVNLHYRGAPLLLREDYSSDQDMRGGGTTRFNRPVRTYLDARTILLLRDGDWRIWPLVSGEHSAIRNAIHLRVPADLAVMSSSEQTRQAGQVLHVWSAQPPQLLLVAGDYQTEQRAEGRISRGSASNPANTDIAVAALRLQHTLTTWLDAPIAASTPQAVTLPYVRDVVIGGNIIGVPALTSFFTVDGYILANEPPLQRVLGLRLAQAVLADRIAWAAASLNTSGEPRSQRTDCTISPAGKQHCITTVLGANSSQAPQGRLVEPRITSPARYALSIVVGNRITALDAQTRAEEQRFWQQLAASDPHSAIRDDNPFEAFFALKRRGLLPQRLSEQEAQHIAQLVVRLDEFYQQTGDVEFAAFVRTLAATHPIGGAPLTTDAFLQQVEAALLNTKDNAAIR